MLPGPALCHALRGESALHALQMALQEAMQLDMLLVHRHVQICERFICGCSYSSWALLAMELRGGA